MAEAAGSSPPVVELSAMTGDDACSNFLEVSVIIPTINAAGHLRGTISACRGVREIVVVDGGSRDDTTEVARSMGARVVVTGASRGIQLHEGAMRSEGEWLLFLHADTVLTEIGRAHV